MTPCLIQKTGNLLCLGKCRTTCCTVPFKGKRQKCHFTFDVLLQLTDFVERLLKHARNGDLQLMRRPIETKFGMLLTYRLEHDIISNLSL